jgi:hypothetical protein
MNFQVRLEMANLSISGYFINPRFEFYLKSMPFGLPFLMPTQDSISILSLTQYSSVSILKPKNSNSNP